jgi:polysaccharide biosynthesis transport protein
MTLSRFLSVIVGRRVAFLATLGSVVLLVVLASLLAPRQYTARAQVMVESRGSVNPGNSMSGPAAAEAELVQSARVSIAALRLLGLQADAGLQNKWQDATDGRGDFETWAGEQLLKKLEVKPSRDSTLLTISYTSKDAAASARTVNAFVQAYVDIATQIREENATRTTGSFSGRTDRLKAALDAAEEKLVSFQREHAISATDDKMDIESLRLAELNTQLVTLQSQAANAAGRQRQSGRSSVDEVLRDPVVSMLSADLARQEARLVELRSRLGEQHPSVIEQRSTLQELRARVDAASRRVTASIAGESRIAAERVATIQSALDAQRTKVIELKAHRNQAQRLQRDVELARRTYDAAVVRANESAMESGGPRESVSIVKTATVPALPSSPRFVVNLVAAILFGLLAGVIAAFWRESRDRRLRLENEVSELLTQPLLGVISSGRSAPARLALPAA